MTDDAAVSTAEPMPAAPVTPRPAWRDDPLRMALTIVAVLVLLGVLLGLVWAWWSPAGPPGVELKAGTVQIDESETFAAGDGRFAVLTGGLGLVAALAVWFARSVRGPLVALGLVVGGLLGAWLTATVGHLAGGGTNHGPANTEIPHLPLNVHLTGMILLEAALAALLYSVLAAFAVSDDLGHPDPRRDAARPSAPAWLTGAGADSVQAEDLSQYSRGDGDTPGLAQQDQLPPQDPGQGA